MVIKKKKELKIIGSKDLIDIPELGIENLPCKIDTGANSCAIHCHKITLREINGKDVLLVRFLDPSIHQYQKKDFVFENFTEKKIKNSFGQSEFRYMIKLRVMLFGELIETEFSLADRGEMRYQVLLGKKILYKRFIVNVSLRNLSHKQKLQSQPL